MRNQQFEDCLLEMGEVHHRKNADYARDDNPYSNFEFAAVMADGFPGTDAVYATLIGVKVARLRELLGRGKTPNNESIDDTLRDLAVYATIWWASHRRD